MRQPWAAIVYGLAVLAFSTQAFAFGKAPAPAPTPSPSDTDSGLDALAQTVVHALTHNVVVFHYDALPTPTASYIPPNDPSGLADVSQRIENGVWNAQDPQTVLNFVDWLGYGFYAALDPMVSSIYGNPDEIGQQTGDVPATGVWRLVVLTLPAGTKYLDLTNDVAFDDQTMSELQNDQCDATSLYGLFLENSEDKVACRAPMRQLLSDLGVGAVLYSWGSAAGALTSVCPALPQAAFYVTEQTVSQSQVVLLSSGLPPSGEDSASVLRHAINSLWGLAGLPRPWPGITPDDDAQTLGTWAKANLFGCGP